MNERGKMGMVDLWAQSNTTHAEAGQIVEWSHIDRSGSTEQ